MPKFEVLTSPPSFANVHPTTLRCMSMLTLPCLSTCPHLKKKTLAKLEKSKY